MARLDTRSLNWINMYDNKYSSLILGSSIVVVSRPIDLVLY